MWVFPDHRATHAQTDAECCEAVADVGVLPKGARQLDHQSNAGAGERMAERDRSTVRVESRIIRGQAEMITERQHLDSECLIDLEGADVIDPQSRLVERFLRRGDGPDSHELRIHTSEGEGDKAHGDRQTQLRCHTLRG